MTDDRSQRTEDRRQMSEDGRQMAEDIGEKLKTPDSKLIVSG